MGGNEAVERLREVNPNVVAIVSSGYSEDPVMSSFGEYGFSGVVAKPYTLNEMRTAVGDALNLARSIS